MSHASIPGYRFGRCGNFCAYYMNARVRRYSREHDVAADPTRPASTLPKRRASLNHGGGEKVSANED